MTFETVFNIGGYHNVYFESIDDAADIAAAYKAGKNVILHLPATESSAGYGFKQDVYVQMIGYQPEYNDGSSYIRCEGLGFSSDYLDTVAEDPEIPDINNYEANIVATKVASNGKLRFRLYVD